MSRGDRGEVTRPGGVGGAVLQSVLPDLFSAARVRGTLACLRVLPSELALGPGTKQAVPRSSGPRAGFLGPVHSAQVWLGPGAGGGSSSPISFSCTLIPDSWGRGRKTAMESRSFVSFSSFRARRWRPLREDPLAGGWQVAWRAGGSTIGRPHQASRRTDEGNNIITPRTPWGRYSKYHIK